MCLFFIREEKGPERGLEGASDLITQTEVEPGSPETVQDQLML